MRKRIFSCVLALCLIAGLAVPALASPDVKTSALLPSLHVGGTLQLRAEAGQTVTWTSSNDTVAKVDEKGLVTALKPGTADISATNADSTYKAVITIRVLPYTVTFDPNGGTLTPSPYTLETDDSGLIAEYPTPVPPKEGIPFQGWFTAADSSGGGPLAADHIFTGDTTVYAHWNIPAYTVTFNANGGTVDPATAVTDMNGHVQLPTPVREDFAFLGWFTAADDSGTQIPADQVFTADTTVYAHWKRTRFTIGFDADGGKVDPETMKTDDSGHIEKYPVPTKEGCEFLGWFLEGAEEPVPQDYQFTDSVLLTAHWKETSPPKDPEEPSNPADPSSPAASYTVTFDANGGTVNPSTAKTDENGRVPSYPVPVRDGYIFVGWYTAAEDGDLVTPLKIYSANTTVYAHWKQPGDAASYTVTFDANGGTVDPATAKTSDSGTLDSYPVPVRSGYDFLGWFTAAEEGESVPKDHVFKADTTLYAHWKLTVDVPSEPEVTNVTVVSDHGDVTVRRRGDKAVLHIEPELGYQLDTVSVKTADGEAIEAVISGNVSFPLPGEDTQVEVTVTYKSWTMPFRDVAMDVWFAPGVQYTYQNGLMTGITEDRFIGSAAATRAEAVTLLWRCDGEQEITIGMPFLDASDTEWYSDAVKWGYETKAFYGYDGLYFGTNDLITREQFVTALFRYAGSPNVEPSLSDFEDSESISPWALKAVGWAVDCGILQGYENRLDPLGSVTRSQLAEMIRLFDKAVVRLPDSQE